MTVTGESQPRWELREIRAGIVSQLGLAEVPDAEVDADLLIGHVLGIGRGEVQAQLVLGRALTADQVDLLTELVSRRAAREPLQHITGTAAFRSLELVVGPGVFVPRPETEQVAQLAIDALRGWEQSPIGVDLGTGSGAIALAMAAEVPAARIFAVEKSAGAYEWARRNVQAQVARNITLVHGDLADAFAELNGQVAVVVSNPPYIPLDAVPRDPEVRLFDPPEALYGGADGLDVVRLVSATALRLLRPGGTLVMEHGELQAEAIARLLSHDGWRRISGHVDLSGRDRGTIAVR